MLYQPHRSVIYSIFGKIFYIFLIAKLTALLEYFDLVQNFHMIFAYKI